jgi:plasmid stability protein
MKNITVSLDDELYRRARIKAAEKNTSVSALVRGFLVGMATEESETERRKRLQNETLAAIRTCQDFRAADRLSRDEIHDRDAIP